MFLGICLLLLPVFPPCLGVYILQNARHLDSQTRSCRDVEEMWMLGVVRLAREGYAGLILACHWLTPSIRTEIYHNVEVDLVRSADRNLRLDTK